MKKVNFDEYVKDYNLLMRKQHKAFGNIAYYSDYKVDILKNIFPNDANNLSILEYGCGTGRNISFINKKFPSSKIFGFDVSRESIDFAKKQNSSLITIDKDEFFDYKAKFDLIFIASVFHHIHPSLRNDSLKDIFSLLKKGGIVVCFEHNPYNLITRYLVNTCDFDKDAVLLKKKELIKLFKKNNFKYLNSAYTLFFPPKLKRFNFLERYLSWLPLGGQYYVSFKK